MYRAMNSENGRFNNKSTGTAINYIDNLNNFLKRSLKLANVLNIPSDIEGYIDIEDIYEGVEKDYILSKRIQISKFYSNTILKIILDDIKCIVLKILRK
jgi:hypothetical protein